MKKKPLKCRGCQKSIGVIYIEMIGQSKKSVEMCLDCPILKKKVNGQDAQKDRIEEKDPLYCKHCATSLAVVLKRNVIGCSRCYARFEERLTHHLLQTKQVADRCESRLTDPFPILHRGRSPFKSQRSEKRTHIRELKQALSEAIQSENYEEAAWLRDQINSLNQGSDDCE